MPRLARSAMANAQAEAKAAQSDAEAAMSAKANAEAEAETAKADAEAAISAKAKAEAEVEAANASARSESKRKDPKWTRGRLQGARSWMDPDHSVVLVLRGDRRFRLQPRRANEKPRRLRLEASVFATNDAVLKKKRLNAELANGRSGFSHLAVYILITFSAM